MLNIKFFIIMEHQKETADLTLAQKCAAIKQELYVGYYVFASGVVSVKKDADSQISGIIVWSNPDTQAPVGSRALMITLEREKKAWTDQHVELGGTNDIDGRQNTIEILRRSAARGVEAPAARYCYEYNHNGVSAGEGFLPSKTQLLKVAINYDCINRSLMNIGAPALYGIYVSSTEAGPEREWEVRLENHSAHVYAKSYCGDYVRCFVAL